MPIEYPGLIPNLLTRFGINPLDFTSWTDLLRELQAVFGALGTNPAGSAGTVANRLAAVEAEVASPALLVTTVNSTAITNTLTETAFSTGQYTVPADSVVVGRTFRITAGGRISTAASAPGYLFFNVRWGSVNTDPLLLALNPEFGGLTPGQANFGWSLQAHVTIRAIGASGAASGMGLAMLIAETFHNVAPGSVTINTTVDRALTLFAQWSTASATNQITLETFIVEQVN